MINPAKNDIMSQLHISFSQIFTYMSCSLKYRFRYVLGKPLNELVSHWPLALRCTGPRSATTDRMPRVISKT
jgi:hypothetical protein